MDKIGISWGLLDCSFVDEFLREELQFIRDNEIFLTRVYACVSGYERLERGLVCEFE